MKTSYLLAAELPQWKHLSCGENCLFLCRFAQLDIQSLLISEPKHLAKLTDSEPWGVDEDHRLCHGQLKLLSFSELRLEWGKWDNLGITYKEVPTVRSYKSQVLTFYIPDTHSPCSQTWSFSRFWKFQALSHTFYCEIPSALGGTWPRPPFPSAMYLLLPKKFG